MTEDFDGIIFDCDGTLVDTMPAHYLAWTRTLAEHGIDFPEDRFYAMGGVPPHRVVAILAEEAGLSIDALAVADAKERMFADSLDTVSPVEKVVAIARANRGRVPMAVATGSPRWSAEHCLTAIGVLEWFDALVSCDDVTHPKPHPQTFLLAAERIGVDPTRCIAYEDSEPGMQAARAAGMHVIDARPLYDR
jgi:HAD superfamily hydrolase (TIGR01509 family)